MIQWVCFMLQLSLVLVVAYKWRAYECELTAPCSIVDIVGSDMNSSPYNSCRSGTKLASND